MSASHGHSGWVNSVCVAPSDEGHFSPPPGPTTLTNVEAHHGRQQVSITAGHPAWVRSLCAVKVDDHHLIASAADDRTVRLWIPDSDRADLAIPPPFSPDAVASPGTRTLAVGGYPYLFSIRLSAPRRSVPLPCRD